MYYVQYTYYEEYVTVNYLQLSVQGLYRGAGEREREGIAEVSACIKIDPWEGHTSRILFDTITTTDILLL